MRALCVLNVSLIHFMCYASVHKHPRCIITLSNSFKDHYIRLLELCLTIVTILQLTYNTTLECCCASVVCVWIRVWHISCVMHLCTETSISSGCNYYFHYSEHRHCCKWGFRNRLTAGQTCLCWRCGSWLCRRPGLECLTTCLSLDIIIHKFNHKLCIQICI